MSELFDDFDPLENELDNIFTIEAQNDEIERLRAELAAAIAERDAAREALRMVEWLDWLGAPNAPTCPWCECDQNEGHAPDCRRQKELGIT